MAGNKKARSNGNLQNNDEVEEIKEESYAKERAPKNILEEDEAKPRSAKTPEVTKDSKKCDSCCTKCVSGLFLLLVGVCLYGVFHYYTQFASLNVDTSDKKSLVLIGKMVISALLAVIISFSRIFYLNKCN